MIKVDSICWKMCRVFSWLETQYKEAMRISVFRVSLLTVQGGARCGSWVDQLAQCAVCRALQGPSHHNPGAHACFPGGLATSHHHMLLLFMLFSPFFEVPGWLFLTFTETLMFSPSSCPPAWLHSYLALIFLPFLWDNCLPFIPINIYHCWLHVRCHALPCFRLDFCTGASPLGTELPSPHLNRLLSAEKTAEGGQMTFLEEAWLQLDKTWIRESPQWRTLGSLGAGEVT